MHGKTDDDKRKQGVVKWYSERLGYGFAEVEGETDEVFIHRTALVQFGLTRLLAEDIVKVSVTDSPRGRIVDVLYGAERLPVDERLIGTVPEADEHFARVKFFNELRGYGFIEVEGYDQDIFVHSRVIEKNGLSTIYQGQRLLVSVEEGDKSWQVRTIRLLAEEGGKVPPQQRQAEAAAMGGRSEGEAKTPLHKEVHGEGHKESEAGADTGAPASPTTDVAGTTASPTTDVADTTDTTDTSATTSDNTDGEADASANGSDSAGGDASANGSDSAGGDASDDADASSDASDADASEEK